MQGLGRDVGAEILVRGNFNNQAAPAGAAINGQALDLRTLPARALSVSGVVIAHGNLDDTDSLVVTDIKLQSSADAAFTTPVDEGSGPNISLASTAANTDLYGQSKVDVDLTQIPDTRPFIRMTGTPTLTAATDGSGGIGACFVFGGLDEVPQT